MNPADPVPIPVVDICDVGVVRHAAEAIDRAQALRDDCLAWLPSSVRALLPAMDALTRRWLMRSCSPYREEVAAIAEGLDISGVWFLNGSYQWGCTSLAREADGVPWLLRTLDWPFPGLGRHLEITRMRGRAGEFLNVGWPGYVGGLTLMAPGRFAAAMNQAPLRRRTRSPRLRPLDFAANALRTWGRRAPPPDHVLRAVFEHCRDFEDARRHLEMAPLARPAIYVLAGCRAGQCCVIERREETCSTRFDDTAAANDWLQNSPGWEARVNTANLLTITYAEAARRGRARREALAAWSGPISRAGFAWVTPPVLNPCTRVAVEMCAADGVLRAVGYERHGGDELPRRVTAGEIKASVALL